MQYKFLAVKKKDSSCRKDRRSSFFFNWCILLVCYFHHQFFTLSMAHGCPVPKHHLIHLEQNRKTKKKKKIL